MMFLKPTVLNTVVSKSLLNVVEHVHTYVYIFRYEVIGMYIHAGIYIYTYVRVMLYVYRLAFFKAS